MTRFERAAIRRIVWDWAVANSGSNAQYCGLNLLIDAPMDTSAVGDDGRVQCRVIVTRGDEIVPDVEVEAGLSAWVEYDADDDTVSVSWTLSGADSRGVFCGQLLRGCWPPECGTNDSIPYILRFADANEAGK